MGNAKRIAKRIVGNRCGDCGELDCECERCPECGDKNCESDECRAMQMEPSHDPQHGVPSEVAFPKGQRYPQAARRIVAAVSVGDEITNPGGVDATDIPIGARVRYTSGVDRKHGEYEVMLSDGKKMLGLGFPATPIWAGHNGPMTVISLPDAIARA